MASSETIEKPEIDESVGEPEERSRSARIDRSKSLYLRKSVNRLSIIADRQLETKSDICAALQDYGYCLSPEQREALKKWCDIT